MREHFVSKNSIRDLWGIQEIHLKQSSLLSTLVRSVILQCIEKESSRLLNHVLSKEHIDDTIDIDKTTTLFIGKLVGKLCSLLRIQSDNVLKETSVVRRISRLFCIGNDFVELAGFCKTCDNLKSA
jgi:hypothetical protein